MNPTVRIRAMSLKPLVEKLSGDQKAWAELVLKNNPPGNILSCDSVMIDAIEKQAGTAMPREPEPTQRAAKPKAQRAKGK